MVGMDAPRDTVISGRLRRHDRGLVDAAALVEGISVSELVERALVAEALRILDLDLPAAPSHDSDDEED